MPAIVFPRDAHLGGPATIAATWIFIGRKAEDLEEARIVIEPANGGD